MGDYYDQSGGQIDQNKAALLAAIAQHGSQAGAAMQQAKDAIAQQRAAAIQAALGEAAQYGGAPNQTADVEQRIGQPYDRRLADLGSADASRQASFGDLSSSAGTYMDEAKASLPALRTQLAEKVAGLQAQVSQAQIKAQQDAEDRALQREKLEADIANSRASASQPDSLSKIIGQLGGQDMAGEMLLPALNDATDQSNRAAFVGSPEDRFDPAERVGGMAGLPGSAVSALAGRAQRRLTAEDEAATRRDQQDANSPAAIRGSGDYQSATADVLNGVHAGKTQTEVAQRLIDTYGAQLAQQVMSDYSWAFNG